MSGEFVEASLREFIGGYVEAALFAETLDDCDRPLQERYMPSDLTPEASAGIEADCRAFLAANAGEFLTAQLKGLTMTEAGRCFWLSRCGHGSGYFDSDEIECPYIRRKLQAAARAAGEAHLLEEGQSLGYFRG